MDRYHIYEAIGKGKHSTVYKGRRKKTIQYYAIKSIDKSQRQRVLREVQVLRATNSNYILKFHAWYETANHLWLVLEYCVGGDLLGVLKQDARLPEPSVKTFAIDLVSALRVSHEAGVLHCDLKPSNLLIDEDGRLKLCGFGLARKVTEVLLKVDGLKGAGGSSGDQSNGSSTATSHKLVGTPCYMAPELFGEDGVHSFASDLWAVGCVLFECACGKPPFVRNSLTELMEMILTDDPNFDVDENNEKENGIAKNKNEMSADFVDLVSGLLEKDPARRITWEEMVSHSFWVGDLTRLVRKPLPAQNAFELAIKRASVGEVEVEDAAGLGAEQLVSPSQLVAKHSPNEKRKVDSEPSLRPVSPERLSEATTLARSVTTLARRSPKSAVKEKLVRTPNSRSKEIVRLSLAARANLKREEGGAGGAYDSKRLNKRPSDLMDPVSPEKRNASSVTETGNDSPRSKASTNAAAAGDVSLADADAELNFSDQTTTAGDIDTVGASARPLSGGGVDDDDSPVSRNASANHSANSNSFSDRVDRGEDLVADPGTEVAAAAAAAERSAAAAEEREASEVAEDTRKEGVAVPVSIKAAYSSPLPSRSQLDSGSPSGKDKSPLLDELDQRILSQVDHPSDSQVKPIVLNRRIEVTPEPHFDANALPFEALTITEMLAADQGELEKFLTKVYRSVAHSSPINEKVNTLSYFETLCCDTASANVLINSSLMTLFVRMLRASKAPSLRVRLTSVMGLLLRHATYITEELASSGIVSVLTECLRDKNERVRRRAAATLGELLFYIATQQHEAAEAKEKKERRLKSNNPKSPDGDATRAAAAAAAAASAWKIPASTVGVVLRTLRAGEDEIAQHYAVKTVENIVSHGGEWALKFCTEETVVSVVGIMTSAKSEQLRGTAASMLSRASKVSPETTKLIVEKYGTSLLVNGLMDPSPKVQQACLNILVRGAGDLGARALKNALENFSVQDAGGGVGGRRLSNAHSTPSKSSSSSSSPLPAIAQLLERGTAVLRAKSLLALASLIRRDNRWLVHITVDTDKANNILPLLDRLQKDKDVYLQNALRVLQDVVASSVPQIHSVVLQDVVRRKALHKANAAAGRSRENREENQSDTLSALNLFPATARVIGCAALRGNTCDDLFATDVAKLLDTAREAALDRISFPGFDKFRGDVLALLERLSRYAASLLSAPQAVCTSLLPSLAKMLAIEVHVDDALSGHSSSHFSSSDAADGRFLALKLTCDVLLPMLMDKEVEGGLRTQLLQLLHETLLPSCPPLLQDEDPIPLYALKLLGGALDLDKQSCKIVVDLGLAPKFFEFLSLEHTNNNVHNVRLCLALSASKSVTMEQLVSFGCANKVQQVLTYAHENSVDPFLEPALGISRAILARAAEAVEIDQGLGTISAQSALNGIAPLLKCVFVYLECSVLGSTECTGPGVPLLAAESLRLLSELLPAETSFELFESEGTGSNGHFTDPSYQSPLSSAISSIGTDAAVRRREAGFGDCGVVEPTTYGGQLGGYNNGAGFGNNSGDSYAYTWSSSGGSGSGAGSSSPRRGFVSAQRTALEVIGACSRVTSNGKKNSNSYTELEQNLRRLARGEPNPSIAAAAAQAADGMKGVVLGY